MLINREVAGAWDQPTAPVVLKRLEPTPLQALALAYADKAAALVDSNERLLDARAGGHGYKDDKRDWNDGGGKNWDGKKRGEQ